ncbi:tetratricopeptide repeat protein [Dawidia soli]|uniref:Tetratricopeptide repeat protein n=1 Tax=Dawidia soli TaxID=2782352 RepID=A0AAP2D7J4_9BACT|nr:tetratricopeptide repeat protein [Dawidia soli]MBT1686863.1 tetratricopeptide repeat protein [Dawidia soli]
MINELDEIIKATPNNADLYFQRGYAKEMDLRYEDCIHDFTKVIELDSNKSLARTNRGFAYRKLGEYEKAIRDFTDELRINPNPYSYEHRGLVKYLLKDNEAAYADISKSIELDPQNSIAYKSRSLVLVAMNRHKDACVDVIKAIELGIKTKYPDYTEEIEKLEINCK